MFVKPTHPNVPDVDRGGYLAPEGREVEQSQYWLRRIADGDVTEAQPPAAEPTQKPTARKGA
jgi:hypothetical protein